MKTFVCIVSLFLSSALCFVAGGCQTSPERTAYVTIGSIGVTANAAIESYHAYIKEHPPTRASYEEARRAISAYLSSVEIARSAVAALKKGEGSPQAVSILLDTAAASATNVVNLINSIAPNTIR